jgi:hypothetical protein
VEKIKKENAIQACANAFKKSFLQKSWKYGKVKLLGDAEIVKQATGQQAIINSSNNELETAQQLAKFITKASFILVDEYLEQVYEQRENSVRWLRAEFKAACDSFEYALDQSNESRNKKLDVAVERFRNCIRKLEEGIEQSISVIKRIDDQDKFSFRVSSVLTLPYCRWNSRNAICYTKNLLRALELQVLAGICANDEVGVLVNLCDEIERNLCDNGDALLMAEYCEKDEEKEFWYSLSNQFADMKERIDYYQEIFGKKQRFPRYRLGDIHKKFFRDREKNSTEKKPNNKKEDFGDEEEIDIEHIF